MILDITILSISVIVALYLGWRRGAVHGSRRTIQLMVAALALHIPEDEFVQFMTDLSAVFKGKSAEVQAGARVVENFLE